MHRRQFLKLSGALGGLTLLGCGSSSKDRGDASPTGPREAALPDSSVPAPAWLAGQPLNSWFEIPGTVHAGSPAAPTDNPMDQYALSNRRLSYSGMALRNSEIILAACGGHGDYSGNEVTSIDLDVDAPTWQLRSAATPMAQIQEDVAYYQDGNPSSRHTYWSHHWNEARQRVMLHRSRFVYGSGVSFNASNGFDLATNRWDPAKTWSDGYDGGCQDADGNVWGISGFDLYKWTASTDTWASTGTGATELVYPLCYDAKRDHLFSFAGGDGQGDAGDGPVSATRITADGSVRTPITFNASDALNQFMTDAPAYAGMEYDPENDQYLFYDGRPGNGRIYAIKPNTGTQWDISIFGLGPTSVTPAAVDVTCNRFRYVAPLRGFVLMATGTSNVYFLRTA